MGSIWDAPQIVVCKKGQRTSQTNIRVFLGFFCQGFRYILWTSPNLNYKVANPLTWGFVADALTCLVLKRQRVSYKTSHKWIKYFTLIRTYTYWILISVNLGASFSCPCRCCSYSTSYSNPGWVLHVYCFLFCESFNLFCILKALINASENSCNICLDLFLISSKMRKSNIGQIYFLTNKKFIFSLFKQLKQTLKKS